MCYPMIYPWKVLFDFTKIYLSDENLHFAAQSNFTEKVFSGKIWASSFDTMFEQRNDYYSSKSNDNSDPFTTFSFISKFNGLFQCKDVSHISIFVANITNKTVKFRKRDKHKFNRWQVLMSRLLNSVPNLISPDLLLAQIQRSAKITVSQLSSFQFWPIIRVYIHLKIF